MSKYTKISPLRQIQIMITMAFILLSSIWFALNSQPVQPVRVVSPDLIVMGRESRSILVNLANGQTLVWEVA